MIISHTSKGIPNSKGFTLVETLVALTILLIAVAGPISLIGDSLHKMYYARDETIGVNLAEEGIEMVRQVRDTNMLNGAAWRTDLGDGTYSIDVGSYISGAVPSGFVIPCGPACAPQPVSINAAGLYGQVYAGTPTQFSRIVTLSSTALPAEAKVTSVVTWKTGGTVGTATLSEYIFSWAL
jgi:prepilin-type N-terminal cleavage/methylation domain-containing protein